MVQRHISGLTARQLVGLLMIQEPVGALGRDFGNAVMQAIID
jgi:hypothetical protein